MFDLTPEELVVYNDKKQVVRDMIRVFGIRGTFPRCDIYNKFTFKEWLSEDFQNVLYAELKPYAGSFNRNFFQNHAYGYGVPKSLDMEYTLEERRYILDVFLKGIYKDGFSSYDFDNILKLVDTISAKDIEEEEKLQALINHNIFAKAGSSKKDEIFAYIDKILSTGKFEDPEKLIVYIQNTFPEYRGLSLIIMNSKVNVDQRIKCLKKIYKQKDLPAFKEHLRKNLTDLDILDIFIEATIFQNNRVKEKEANLIKLFKDIFIGGTYESKYIYKKALHHEKEFSKKYVKYLLDPVFAKKMYSECVSTMSTQQYNREDNWKNFLQLITSSLNSKEIINAVETVPVLKDLGENFPNRFSSAYISEDVDVQKDYIRVFSTWAINSDPDALWDSLKSVHDPLPETIIADFEDKSVFERFLNNYKIFAYDKSANYGVSAGHLTKEICHYLFCGFDTFHMSKIMEDEDIVTLGISIEKFKNSKFIKSNTWNHRLYLGTGMKNLERFYSALYDKFVVIDTLFGTITDSSKNADESFAKIERYARYGVDRFFSPFENEFNSRELMNNVMSLQDSDFKQVELRGISHWNPTKVESAKLYTDIIEKAFESGKIAYKLLTKFDPSYQERGENFEKNLTETLNGIKLLCAFNEY